MNNLKEYILEKFKIKRNINPRAQDFITKYLVIPWGQTYTILTNNKVGKLYRGIVHDVDGYIFTGEEIVKIYNKYIKGNKDLNPNYDRLYIFEYPEEFEDDIKGFSDFVEKNKIFKNDDGLESQWDEVDIDFIIQRYE